MTREEAREELIEEWNEFIDGCGLRGIEEKEAKRNPDFKKVYEANFMAIQALEQEPKTEWIPVSERLPEKNGRYLCTVGTDYRNPREMYYEPKGKNNRTWASLDRAYVEDCFVIAWMPLPRPYKTESEDKE